MRSPHETLLSLRHVIRPLTQSGIGRPRIRAREAVSYILAFTLAVVTVGFAITRMHYTGMAASSYLPSPLKENASQAVSVSSLGATGIATVTLTVLALAMLAFLVGLQDPSARRLIRPLTYVFFAVMGGMAAYEGLKMVVFPYITIWASHLMTIGVSSVAAVVAGYFVLQRQSRLLERAVVELRERKRAEAESARLAVIVNSTNDAIFSSPLDGLIATWNAGAERVYGYAAEEIKGKHLSNLILEDRRGELPANVERLSRGEALVDYEDEHMRKDGSKVQVSLTLSPIKDAAGVVTGVSAIARDITERKRAEQELWRVNRALRTISECNQVLVRAVEESHLLDDICGILVREGGYRMAWVGFGEHDDGKSVRPVAHVGFEEGYLPITNITWADTERGRGPTGTAIRTGKPVVARDIQTEPSLAAWREDALKRGYASSIALPILLKNQVLGALTIYAGEVDAFDSAEVQLLTELSNDLAYGIEALRTRTERKRAEEALRESEERFRELVEMLPEIVVEVDARGMVTFANRQAFAITGYSEENIRHGFNVLEFFVPEERERAARNIQGTFRGKFHAYEEYIAQRKDGTRFYVAARSTASIRAGQIVGFRAIVVDITQQKLKEEALRESEERFRSLVENATVGIYRTTPQGRILMANPTMVRMLGYEDFQELAARNLEKQELGPGYARRAFREHVERDGEVKGLESAWTRPDASVIFVRESARVVRGESGNVLCYDGIVEDITERRRAEEELMEERHLLHTLMDNLPDVIYFKDRESHFTRINKAHAKQFGLSDPAQAAGKTDFDFFAAEHAQMAYKDEQEIIRTGQPMVGKEEKETWPDGRVTWVSTTKMPLRDANGNIIGTFGVSHDVTERKRAEEALRESEEKYRALVSNIPDVSWTLDAKSRFVFISSNIERVSGFSPDEVYQHGAGLYLSSLHPDDVHKVSEGIRALFAEGRPFDVEVRAKRKDGEWRWVHHRALATYEKNGIRYADGLLSDITERKRAEEELYQSRQMLQSILDTIPQRVFWKDSNTSFLGCNKAFAIDAGLKEPAEVIGKNDHDLAWRETAERYRADDKLVMESETPRLNFEEPQNRPDGSLLWLRTNKLPLRDREGKVIGLIGTYEDITERRRAEAEHVRLVTAIEQSAEGVVITSTSGDIEYVNPAFTRITGYSRGEVLGQNPRILKSDKQDLEFYQQLWATILQGEIWHGELINRKKDGSLYTEDMNITPVRGARGEISHFVATKQDVTERKSLEAHLQQATKMEAVGRLAGGVAHDFNNLLTIINGYTEILLGKFASNRQATAHLKEVKDAGERAASLTRQLLAFSRRQVLAPQLLNLNAVVFNLEKMLKRLIGEDITLRTLLDPSLGQVKADPGQIEQVIMNLAVNARDAMPSGGNLTIETSNVELDEIYARRHATVKPGPHVMLAVSDTGTGMTAETQARIFEPFFTTKEKGKGTGLGLATVYGIVKQSGGSIWVYSELGQGAIFKIYFPTVSESPEVRGSAKTEMDSVPGSETIVVVEDEEGVRSLIRLALESAGYKVLEAEDAESTLSMCANYDGPIHLLLTDVVMPKMSGPLLAEKVISLRPDIKVVYMSGYTDDAVVHHGVLSHDMPFIQKPFSAEAVCKKIREFLGEK